VAVFPAAKRLVDRGAEPCPRRSLGLGLPSSPAQLRQQGKLRERVFVGVPVDVLDAQLRGLVQVGGNLLNRTDQRSALVLRLGGDVAVHLKHDRQRVGVDAGGAGRRSKGLDTLADRVPVEDH
jgi:hypothetical protein